VSGWPRRKCARATRSICVIIPQSGTGLGAGNVILFTDVPSYCATWASVPRLAVLQFIGASQVRPGTGGAVKVCRVCLPRYPVHCGGGIAFQREERFPEQLDADVVEERGELLLLFLSLAAFRTRSSACDTRSRLCIRSVLCSLAFPLAPALCSTSSTTPTWRSLRCSVETGSSGRKMQRRRQIEREPPAPSWRR
jgi:hypothetical protein